MGKDARKLQTRDGATHLMLIGTFGHKPGGGGGYCRQKIARHCAESDVDRQVWPQHVHGLGLDGFEKSTPASLTWTKWTKHPCWALAAAKALFTSKTSPQTGSQTCELDPSNNVGMHTSMTILFITSSLQYHTAPANVKDVCATCVARLIYSCHSCIYGTAPCRGRWQCCTAMRNDPCDQMSHHSLD